MERSFLFKQANRQAAQQGKVFSTMTSANPGSILSEGNIENPVELIFNPPMGANGTTDGNRITFSEN